MPTFLAVGLVVVLVCFALSLVLLFTPWHWFSRFRGRWFAALSRLNDSVE